MVVVDGSADATDWREAETRLRQDRTPHLDRHLDQDSDLDVTLPTYHTTPHHRRIPNMGALLSLPLLAIPSVGTVSPVLRRSTSKSSYTDAWPTARNSSSIMLWRRNMQRSV